MSKDNEIAVDIQNVTKMFGGFTALKGVSLDIRDNEFFYITRPFWMRKDYLAAIDCRV